MANAKSPITRETFRFFRDLARNNRTEWMEAHRDRYKQTVVQPLRALCEELTPEVLRLNPGFDCRGRSGANFSRINRDTRFANDKTPYRAQMYLKFAVPFASEGETGQLYAGFSADAVTAGFRIYCGSKYRESALAKIAGPHLEANPRWLAQQKKRLSRRYESYWYSTEKGEWTKHAGWPPSENWKKVKAWIVRRKLSTAAATRTTFTGDLTKVFRELYPLLRFTSVNE
ncbi:MAG TPA: DUF2461 family protein [Candidatus Acidoferrales bacterium]|nr:DUF2461 family protein [Candidatus Acidoferrales bacterium]